MSMGMGTAGKLVERAIDNLTVAHEAFVTVRDRVHSAHGNAGALAFNGYPTETLASLLEGVTAALDDSEAALLQALSIAREFKEN